MLRTIALIGLGLICAACVRMEWVDLVAPAGMTVGESDRAVYECQRDAMGLPKNLPRTAGQPGSVPQSFANLTASANDLAAEDRFMQACLLAKGWTKAR